MKMANFNSEPECLPKTGRVNAVCKEWSVREDGALAYHLQNKEISEHLQSNKFKNAVVRQDFPRALNEQMKEQQLAEQAAAVYHQMLAEQEEIDNHYAQELATKIEIEELSKRRLMEDENEKIVRRMIQNENQYENVSPKFHNRHHLQEVSTRFYKKLDLSDRDSYMQQFKSERVVDRRVGSPMPLPQDRIDPFSSSNSCINDENITSDHCLYTEPYRAADTLAHQLGQINMTELGIPNNDVKERIIQEQKDALLARQLQQQEDLSEYSQLNRDRLLAIEAQDKELAKLLQERERQKAKRAKERAKQKALAKKQQMQEQKDIHQIMPDDSYSDPADLLPTAAQNININHRGAGKLHIHNQHSDNNEEVNEDTNYSFPVDVLPSKNIITSSKLKKHCDTQGNLQLLQESFDDINIKTRGAVRPNQLDLKVLNNPSIKPISPDRETIENSGSSPHHTNIAMAIDPTYNRKSRHSTPYLDTSSSTVTSTSSGSIGMFLSPPELSDLDDESPIPPYMPIQGQRRTASLEKKSKKKSKDGCKQQ